MMKLLTTLLMLAALMQSCTGDIEDLEDPRDAIAKEWSVTDSDNQSYKVTINKDANDKTKVFFSGQEGFHMLQLSKKLYATIAAKTLTIYKQTIDDYTIKGTGVITQTGEEISFTYTVQAGNDPEKSYTANYGKVQVAKKKNTLQ